MIPQDSSKYTSPASPLPLHELKVLQEYIHHQNVQIIGDVNPKRRNEIMLSQFFKSHKNQTVRVRRNSSTGIKESVAKTEAVGRDFVILTTLLTKYWVPFHSIVSADLPYEQVNIPHHQHQQMALDDDLKHKLLLKFGKTVSQKEFLKQQFFDQTLIGHLQILMKNKVIIETKNGRVNGRFMHASSNGIEWIERGVKGSAKWNEVYCIEKQRFF
ncbi:hypothetical protein ACFSVM_08835 [Paenibacillus shunpengii]|uniref:Uncharacterized protein n=1 Tax=Paenibacillus shunpengii TaxID=2054424 RepID=A0ABW5SMD3_9BACL